MFDVIIKNGSVIDGSGNRPIAADIGVINGKIAQMASALADPAQETIDAAGLVVSPGFIDMHTHSDFSLLLEPLAESKIRQGVTTEVTGNCGGSPAPVLSHRRYDCMEYLSSLGRIYKKQLPPQAWNWDSLDAFYTELYQKGVAVNLVPLVGHSTLRSNIMGYENRPPTPDELQQMKRLLEIELEKGAFGLSSGLIYHPGAFAVADELGELAAVVAAADGVYSTHMRSEGRFLFEAVDEALSVARCSGVSLQISHLKCETPVLWGQADRLLQRIDRARDSGLRVDFDQYPYTAYSTGLLEIFPTWAKANGTVKTIQVLSEPKLRQAVVDGMTHPADDWDNPMEGLGWDQIRIVGYERPMNLVLNGLTVTAMAALRGQDPLEAIFDVFIEEQGHLSMIVFSMSEADLMTILRHPVGMIGSDGCAVSPLGPFGKSPVHPRFYGTFPRVLGRYVREKQVVTLATAIRKMTGLPAQKLGLTQRGLIRTNMAADMVVFDPATVTDGATFESPHQYPSGIAHVLVNGEAVIRNGEHTGRLPGRRLSRGE